VRAANEQVMKSGQYAFRDRRAKKGEFRRLWIQRINAGCRIHEMSYSRFIAGLNAAGIDGRPQDARRPRRDGHRRVRPTGRVSEGGARHRVSELLTFSNPKIQRLRRLLGRRSARHDEGAFGVEGPGLIAEAFTNGWEIEALFVAFGTVPESLGLPAELQRADIPTYHLDDKVIERVASTETPQPMDRGRTDTPRRLVDVTGRDVRRGRRPHQRSWERRHHAPVGGGCGRRGGGAHERVGRPLQPQGRARVRRRAVRGPVVADVPLDAVLAAPGTRSYGTTSRPARAYTDADFTAPTTLVVGNEAHGLDPAAPVDEWVTIPHRGRAESLNVAMATTLLVFEVARQRAAR
jgi:hypothetical protein